MTTIVSLPILGLKKRKVQMLNKIFFFVLTVSAPFLHAEIKEITNIEEILPYVNEKTLILLDIDDTLLKSSMAVGNHTWRRFVRPLIGNRRTDEGYKVFDLLTFQIAHSVPPKAVEPQTPTLVSDWQERGNVVMGLTARGRETWYSTQFCLVDQLTEAQLASIGISFCCTSFPPELLNSDSSYIYGGIIFAGHIDKGTILRLILQNSGYCPEEVIFVDDMRIQVESVEAAMKEMGIPYTGFWYRRSAIDNEGSDPMVGNVQLERLFLDGCLIDDAAAREQIPPNANARTYFLNLLNQIDLEELCP